MSTELLNQQAPREKTSYPPKRFILELSVAMSEHIPGHIMEFGVAEGDATRILRRASAHSKKRVYACDSFEGLPEKYENAEVGAFACEPPKIPGVEIVKGYFDASLTPELAKQVGQVSLASLDADLYSSTICVLRWLTPLLRTGSLLLFDEFIGENESEKRAFEDWSKETGVQTVMLAEFVREPSGWGEINDRRTLYQVVGKDNLPPRPKTLNDRVFAYRPARRVRNVIKKLLGRA